MGFQRIVSEPGKFKIEDLTPALAMCTHLIYGFAGVKADTLEMELLNPKLDSGAGYGYYKLATQLKPAFPGLKVYLSIGGNADPYEDTHEYLRIVCKIDRRIRLILYVIFAILDRNARS